MGETDTIPNPWLAVEDAQKRYRTGRERTVVNRGPFVGLFAIFSSASGLIERTDICRINEHQIPIVVA